MCVRRGGQKVRRSNNVQPGFRETPDRHNADSTLQVALREPIKAKKGKMQQNKKYAKHSRDFLQVHSFFFFFFSSLSLAM
jgi:hypothetical protein